MCHTINEPSEYELLSNVLSATICIDTIPFFQYRAAPISQTSLSFDIDGILSDSEKGELFNSILGDRRDYFVFGPDATKEIDRIHEIGLSDQSLTLDGNKGWFWSRHGDKKTDESNARALGELLRHIRNAIAHGSMAFEDGYIILEDRFPRSSKSDFLSARIIVDPDSFQEWAAMVNHACLNARNG